MTFLAALYSAPRMVKKIELAVSGGFTTNPVSRKFLSTAGGAFLSPILSQTPELVHFPLYAGIFKKSLVLLENVLSSEIRGTRMGGVK